MFASPITSILTASLSKSYNEKKENEVKDLLQYSIKYYLVVAIPATIGLAVLSKPLLTILSTTEIAMNSYMITPIVATGFLLLGLTNIIVNIIILKTETKIIGITWVVASSLNIILNLVLIPIYGVVGAALATLIAYTIPLIVITHFSFKYIKLDLNYYNFIKVYLASIPMIIIYQIWKPINIIDLLIFILINSIFYLILVIAFKVFTTDELSLIWGILNLNSK